MKNDVSKNSQSAGASEGIPVLTTNEKAQYEVFKTGNLTRETLEQWLKNDLKSIRAFCFTVERDPEIWKTFVDVHYKRYAELHAQKGEENGKS